MQFLSRMRSGILALTPLRPGKHASSGQKGDTAEKEASVPAGQPRSVRGRALGDEDHLDLGQASLAIQDGLLMVLGPDGDPVPPAAFCAAATAQPDAALALPDGPRVAARRVAVALEAQARGRLAESQGGTDAWIRAMLGVEAPPEAAAPDELIAEAAASGAELTLFGKELLISTPSGPSFILGPARAEGAAIELLAILWQDGTRIGAQGLSARLRRGVAGPNPDALPGGGFGRRPELVSEMPLPGCILLLDDEVLTLSTPWGERFRFIPAGRDASDPPPVRICRPDGEPVTSRQLAEALGLIDRTDRPPPEETFSEAVPDDPTVGESSTVASDRASARDESVEPLAPDTDGTLSLGWLAEAAADLDGPLVEAMLAGLPEGATLSAGIDNGDGSWSLAAQDLQDLILFAPPEPAGAFELDATLTTPVGDSKIRVPIVCAAAVPPEVTAPAEPLDQIAAHLPDQIPDSTIHVDPPSQEALQGDGHDDEILPTSPLEPAAGCEREPAPTNANEALLQQVTGEASSAHAPHPVVRQVEVRAGAGSSASAPEPSVELPERSHPCAPARIEDAERAAAVAAPAPSPGRDDVAQPHAGPRPSEPEGPATGPPRLPLDFGLPFSGLVGGCAPAAVLIEGVPRGASLSAGVDNGDGTWTLTPAQLTGLGITFAAGTPERVTLCATAIGIDRDGGMSSVSSELWIPAHGSSAPREGAGVKDGDEIALHLGEVVRDLAGEEPARAIVIGGLPQGAGLYSGTYDPQIASWIVRPDQLEDLRLTGPISGPVRISLRITAVVVDRVSGKSDAMSRTVEVDLASERALRRRTASRVGGIGFWRPLAERRAALRSDGGA